MKTRIFPCLIIAALSVSAISAVARPNPQRGSIPDPPGPEVRTPVFETVDQITHSIGNIATTVDNYGYVGGYSYYGLPSGEWPRGTGRDYIGETKYWMGAITPSGDTVVANTEDDFQAVPNLISGLSDYRILLSTDSTRYFDYDRSDTVGAGHGNPANGWRVFNLDSNTWTYQTNYVPADSTFEPGGPVSLQESHFRFNDAATTSPPLGIEITHTILQWNYCYNQNFMFVILDIKNQSPTDYTNFAFGLYIDMDVGGPNSSGENGRLGDLVGFDSAQNLAWTYDSDGRDEGWGPLVQTGIMGTKYLETPDNIGMTAFRVGEWEQLNQVEDPARYEFIDAQQFDDTGEPRDQIYVQCTRGIDFPSGKSVRVVYALIAGQDEADFRANAALAQVLYDNYFVGPQPPTTPTLKVRAGDRKVYLSWNDTAEVTVDPLSGQLDFVGYKLYRSDNQGKTWGDPIYNTGNNCLTQDYSTIATYTKGSPGDLIQHSLVDTGLYNGVEYWYCLAAFDEKDTTTGIDPLQSGFGVPGIAPNVVKMTPRTNPAGYYSSAATVVHEYTGSSEPSAGTVTPMVFDEAALTGGEYAVTFEDAPDVTTWNLINTETNDTLLRQQSIENVDPGLFPVAEGLRVVINQETPREPLSIDQTAFGGSDTTLVIRSWFASTAEQFFGQLFGDMNYRPTYELRYTGDSTYAVNFADPGYVLYTVPFECWNLETNQRVWLAVYDAALDGTWEPNNILNIVNYPYEADNLPPDIYEVAWPYNFSWLFRLDTAYYNRGVNVGDVMRFAGPPLNSPNDRFTFKIDGVNGAVAAVNLKNIKVVPDPYFVQYSSMVETQPGQAVLEFQHVPNRCTIRIYTLSGDLVRTLEHDDNSGTARWDLLSSNNQQVASGIYLYHVESPFGEHLGRFSVLK